MWTLYFRGHLNSYRFPFSSFGYFYSWLRLSNIVDLSFEYGEQPYSFPVLSRLCNDQDHERTSVPIHTFFSQLRIVYGRFTAFSPSFIPGIWPFWGLVIVKKKTNWCQNSFSSAISASTEVIRKLRLQTWQNNACCKTLINDLTFRMPQHTSSEVTVG